MKLILNIILALSLLILSNCSENSAAGSSSSENAKVLAGVIIDTNGIPLNNVAVSIYDINETVPFSVTNTDESGRFNFEIDQLAAFSVLSNYCPKVSAYEFYNNFEQDTLWDTLFVKRNGDVKLIFDAELNQANDSIKIAGTNCAYSLLDALINKNDQWEIVLTDLPAASLGTVILAQPDQTIELAPALKVYEAESSSVIIKNSEALHQWDIEITVSVKEVVADAFGGLDSIKIKINQQLDSASKIINSLSGLSGEFNFNADSFTTFTGSAVTEGVKPLGDAAHRLLYTDSTLSSREERGLVDVRLHYLWLSSLNYSFFQEWDLNLLVHLLTEGRGAIPTQYFNVDSGSYPVEHTGFQAVSSVMNKNSYSDFMTNYTKGVLSENRDHVGGERAILFKALPDTIVLLDSLKLSESVIVYKSTLSSTTLDSTSVMSIDVSINETFNEFKIPKEIFLLGNNIENGILLIISDADQRRWLTLGEVAGAWFEGDKSEYFITF